MGYKSKYSGRQLEEKLDSIKNINVDDTLSLESTNPVQSKAVKEYVDAKLGEVNTKLGEVNAKLDDINGEEV